MSERDYRLFLQDILDSVVKIEKYTNDIDFKEFRNSDKKGLFSLLILV